MKRQYSKWTDACSVEKWLRHIKQNCLSCADFASLEVMQLSILQIQCTEIIVPLHKSLLAVDIIAKWSLHIDNGFSLFCM